MSDSGSIAIPNFDTTIRNPGVYVSIDPSGANTATASKRTLVIAQMLATGTAVADVPVICGSTGNAATRGGLGSLLHKMVERYFLQDPNRELWVLPLADDSDGVAATGGFGITGTATQNGTLAMYIGGDRYAAGIIAGQSAATICANLLAAADLTEASYTLALTSTTFAVTFKHKGLVGNDLDIRVNFGGVLAGEVLPPGISVSVTPMSGGEVNPDITAGLDNLSEQAFATYVMPYTDSPNMGAMKALLSTATGRWAPTTMLFGHAFTAYLGTFGLVDTFGALQNDEHMTVLGYDDSPDPPWIWAADYAGVCMASLAVNPNLPLQNIALGVKAPPVASRFLFGQRNTLLYTGIATWRVDDSGTVILDRAVTTYQRNLAGAVDDSFLDTEVDYALADLVSSWRTMIQTQFARKILVIDGTVLPGGSAMVTSQTVRAATISWYTGRCTAGRAQDPAGFTAACISQNAGGGQVRITLPFRLCNQLRQEAAVVDFTRP